MTWHGYIIIQDLNLNVNQRQALWQLFKELYPSDSDSFLHHKNRMRVSAAGDKALVRMLFDKDMLTVDSFKRKLSNVFNVGIETINHSATSVTYGNLSCPVLTFSRSGINYFRVILFGNMEVSYQESFAATKDYFKANIAEWE